MTHEIDTVHCWDGDVLIQKFTLARKVGGDCLRREMVGFIASGGAHMRGRLFGSSGKIAEALRINCYPFYLISTGVDHKYGGEVRWRIVDCQDVGLATVKFDASDRVIGWELLS